jgi:hypothetical protein
MQGDVVRATALLEEVLASGRAIGLTWGIANVCTLLGHLACHQQNYAVAKARYRESLALYRTLGNATYIAWCLEGYAAALCAEEHYAQATRLCAAAVALREKVQTPLPPAERETFEQTITTSKAVLDEQTFALELAAGAALTQEEAIDYALSDAYA